jgi:serine phosphatase RsbU (regulator of sigma subunit)
VGKDGSLAIANAGHLPPYLHGEEVQVDSGLPLGLNGEGEYQETSFQLSPGDRLTLLSDGVVEARNPTDGLFGFERTASISRQTADEVAQAAQSFGQEDDITVLTLTFAADEVAHA